MTSWPWPEVKFWPWPFEVKKYIFRTVSARETRWCHRRFAIFISSKVIREKRLSPKTWPDLWWPWHWPERKNDQSNFEHNPYKESNAVYRVSLSPSVFEIEGGWNQPPATARNARRPAKAQVKKMWGWTHCKKNSLSYVIFSSKDEVWWSFPLCSSNGQGIKDSVHINFVKFLKKAHQLTEFDDIWCNWPPSAACIIFITQSGQGRGA